MSQVSGERTLWANLSSRIVFAVVVLSANEQAVEAGETNPLRCDLVREANLIRCEVHADKVNVSDAAVNDGKCRSPALVYEYNLRMVQQMTGSRAAGSGDFRRAYEKGQTFSLYVDKGCAVYRYSVTADGKAWSFTGN